MYIHTCIHSLIIVLIAGRSRADGLEGEVFEMLDTLGDFEVFKATMIDYRLDMEDDPSRNFQGLLTVTPVSYRGH
jgi:hypothetical protein